MIKYESNCVDCKSVGLHCIGAGCPNRKKTPVPYCDECGHEITDSICFDDGDMLCEACLVDRHSVDLEDLV